VDVEIFIHPTCATCHRLINSLKEWGYLDKVRLIDTSRDPYIAIKRGVRSVPSIFINGELVFAGVVDFKELRRIMEGGIGASRVGISDEELVSRFFNGILDSVSTALWLYINEDCGAFLKDEGFVLAMTNLSLAENKGELMGRLREVLGDGCGGYIEEMEDHFHAVITRNLAREIYWLHGKPLSWSEVSRLYPMEVLAHWMLIRSALGRVGLRMRSIGDERFRAKVKRTREYMERNFDEAMKLVAKEQERILGEKGYWDTLERFRR
jgi:predicted thioredoxin/glutaredoxin